ncbi:MAG: hypothetical protein Terrestrivirus2_186 [Terrestrivirus sp.]|uniref:Uncharacterized protein n=1 Tax=Terrestrivirus sp. TaxID=2487775 RepID=A0A3G4ZLH6_9VIRU|nr:MAG: hypothetical protein Terrestrivirus2_186 [Terrestrivirus sp.]
MSKIFVKKCDIPISYNKVKTDIVKETIPPGSYTIEQPLLSNHMVEMRWRFLHIPIEHLNTTKGDNSTKTKNKTVQKIVEMSRKKPDNSREYLNKQMKWVISEVDELFDQYVTEQYFFYTED